MYLDRDLTMPNLLLRQIMLVTIILAAASAQPVDFNISHLPIVIIDTQGVDIPNEPKIPAIMGIIDNGPGQYNLIDDPWNGYDGWIGIETRGSSTQQFPKKSYAVETRDSTGASLNTPLLGMPTENDWILYGPYSDKSLIRNVLLYRLARDLGWYASRTRLCELVLNGEFQGLYVILEKIKRDDNRVNITPLLPEDSYPPEVTGGYIIKIDKMDGDENAGWNSSFLPYEGAWQIIFFQYHYPDENALNPFQRGYISTAINQIENVLDGPDFADPVTGYPSVLNVSSFVDFLLLNELSKNVDGYRISTFLYKDRDTEDGRLVMGPVWDFNLAFGNADYYDGWVNSGWQYEFPFTWDGFQVPFWWSRLMDEENFHGAVAARWEDLRSDILALNRIYTLVDSLTNAIGAAQMRNFQQWPILDQDVWPNYYVGGSYENEINYLKGWITNRFLWLDANLQATPVVAPLITEINYNSAPFADTEDWVEIWNPHDQALNLAGWRLTDNNQDEGFSLPAGTVLQPGQYLIICRDTLAFRSIHDDPITIVGNIEFGFSNGSDLVQLRTPTDQIMSAIYYDDDAPWPIAADGYGLTLEYIDINDSPSDPSAWQASWQLGGTPGGPASSAVYSGIRLNEFMASNQSTASDDLGEFDDWLELTNIDGIPMPIGGMGLTDGNAPPHILPAGSIAAQDYSLFWCDNSPEQGSDHLNFSLQGSGEALFLYDSDGTTLLDWVIFDDQLPDVSWGRYPDGEGIWGFQSVATPGTGNTGFLSGCTDPDALNYNPDAISDDGSCFFGGDVTLDGLVDILDVVMMVGIVLGEIAPTEEQLLAGDPSQDGVIDILDIVLLVEIILGL